MYNRVKKLAEQEAKRKHKEDVLKSFQVSISLILFKLSLKNQWIIGRSRETKGKEKYQIINNSYMILLLFYYCSLKEYLYEWNDIT